jgi:CSLREA domain-containing protein
LPSTAGATIIPVTTTADVVMNDELCSLREAINAATSNAPVLRGGGENDCPGGQAGPAVDTVQLAAATYSMAMTTSMGAGSENFNANGDFDLDFSSSGPLVIDGVLGAGDVPLTILDAADKDRFFDVNGPGTTVLDIREVIIRNGKPPEDNSHGGAIYIRDDNANFELNTARIENSDALGWGGGMAVNGDEMASPDVDVIQVEFSGNDAVDDGGALWIDGPEDDEAFKIQRSAFVTNHTDQMGGAIYIKQDGDTDDEPVVGLYNSTLSGNTAEVDGGAIAFAFGLGGTLFTEFTTIANNSTPAMGEAGGIATTVGIDEFILGEGMILAGNTAAGMPANCVPEVMSEFGGGDGSIETGPVKCFPNSTIADPLLTEMSYNATGDQTTRTHAISATSPAANLLAAATCSAMTNIEGLDQRGVARPIGANCDAGAFEAPAAAATTTPVTPVTPTAPAKKKCKKKKKKKRSASAAKKKKCKKKKKKR